VRAKPPAVLHTEDQARLKLAQTKTRRQGAP
jgi:hypothetical protein